jgi:hypothetical protein
MKRGRLQRSDVPHWLVRGIAQWHFAHKGFPWGPPPGGWTSPHAVRMFCALLPYVVRGEHPTRWPTVADGGRALWTSCFLHWETNSRRDPYARERAILDDGRRLFDRVLTLDNDERARCLLGTFVAMAQARRDDLRALDV